MRQFPDNDVLGRMQSALMAWRRISEAMRQIVRASEGQASRALFDDLEAVAHAFDSFPMLWAHVGDLRRALGAVEDEVEVRAVETLLGPELPAKPVERRGPGFIGHYPVPPGVTMHQDKCAAIRDWTYPCDCVATVTPKEVAQGFLDPPLPREVLTRPIGGPQNAPEGPVGPETPADPVQGANGPAGRPSCGFCGDQGRLGLCPACGLGSGRRFMVCTDCLKRFYGGAYKACGHGWDMLTGKPKVGPCGECGQTVHDLHCPDGPRQCPICVDKQGFCAHVAGVRADEVPPFLTAKNQKSVISEDLFAPTRTEKPYRPEDLVVTFAGKRLGPPVSGERVQTGRWRKPGQQYCGTCGGYGSAPAGQPWAPCLNCPKPEPAAQRLGTACPQCKGPIEPGDECVYVKGIAYCPMCAGSFGPDI